jgi:hypothetical protein
MSCHMELRSKTVLQNVLSTQDLVPFTSELHLGRDNSKNWKFVTGILHSVRETLGPSLYFTCHKFWFTDMMFVTHVYVRCLQNYERWWQKHNEYHKNIWYGFEGFFFVIPFYLQSALVHSTLPPSLSRLSRQCGILNIYRPLYKPLRPVTGIAY